MAIHRSVAAASLLLAVSGCVCPPRSTEPLPPPISTEEQLHQLTAWAQQFSLLRATARDGGTVHIEYLDDKGNKQSQNVDGNLAIRVNAGAPADVQLIGRVFEKVVLDAGANSSQWWFQLEFDKDNNVALVGDPRAPVSWPDAPGDSPIGALRISLVPELLGLAGVGPDPLMKVDDAGGVNRLFYTARAGMLHFDREYVINRRHGQLSEVHIYNDQGVVMLSSELSKYKPVSYAEGADKPPKIPLFPRHVKVSFPARHLTVTLDFNDVLVVDHFPPAAFSPPDLAGKHVQHVD